MTKIEKTNTDEIIDKLIERKTNSQQANCLWVNTTAKTEAWIRLQEDHYNKLIQAGFPFITGKYAKRKILKVISEKDYQ